MRWRLAAGAAAAALAIGLAAALVAWRNVAGEDDPAPASADRPAIAGSVERGAYLALAGNCAGCHTARGGTAYAGGRGIETPFGIVYASNLTPDRDTGLGAWTRSDFWRAMHNGRSRDGRLLYPAFPYPNFTLVERSDADALFDYLRTVVPHRQPNRRHELRFPYDLQASLAVWRALFFRPAAFAPDPARSAAWNRGSYLVRGLGHCTACHAPRNAWGATLDDAGRYGGLDAGPGGGFVAAARWYAPSLASPHEAGVGGWPEGDVVALLRDGVSARGSATGPMAEVVFRSTQHLTGDDLAAMAAFLASLPADAPPPAPAAPARADVYAAGQRIYADACAGCHGERGEGVAGRYPALAGNRSLLLARANNAIQAVVHGGYPPVTAGNPRPYGMPPFAPSLDDAQIAAVLSYARQSWGNAAAEVSALEVGRAR